MNSRVSSWLLIDEYDWFRKVNLSKLQCVREWKKKWRIENKINKTELFERLLTSTHKTNWQSNDINSWARYIWWIWGTEDIYVCGRATRRVKIVIVIVRNAEKTKKSSIRERTKKRNEVDCILQIIIAISMNLPSVTLWAQDLGSFTNANVIRSYSKRILLQCVIKI